ncbi:kinase-like domain-containing protein [Flammula alnicola]|nr:kinase-like domain-containing protein [Flammula alnicola]
MYLSRALQLLRRSPREILTFPEEPLGLSVAEEGGFYAAALTSTLNSRYTLIGKLGWGVHSSVWLARDMNRQRHAHQRYAAVKILSTHATQVQGRLANELDILQRINSDNVKAHPGRKHIATLLDNFTVTDRHGPHLCLVFEALGAFKGSVYNPGANLPVAFVKDIARQLLLALDFLHRECRIVHTDLKPDNILITLPNAEEAIQRHTTGVSESEALPAMPDSSPPVVLSRPIVPFSSDELQNASNLSNYEIKLTDFGTAAMADGPHADVIQPYALRAPEVILGNGWHTSADIWNLGCLLFEFLTGKWLFAPRSGPTWSAESYHLAHMPVIAGEEFDFAYIRKGKHFEQYFTPEGRLSIQVPNIRNLEQALDAYRVLDDVEKPLCIEFLQSMLRLKPSDRTSAAELLEHEWIKS